MKDFKSKFPEFHDAADELDLVVLDGHFGEEAKRLVEIRDDYDVVDYLYKILTDWHEDKNQFQKDKVYQYMFIIFNLFLKAIEENSKESVELISNFKLGRKDNTAMEFMTAYSEYAKVFNDIKLLYKEMNADPNNISKKLRYTKSMSVAYANGVEYISKTLNLLICLEMIINKKKYNFYNINKMKLYEKISILNKNNQYDLLLEMIDRNLRNAEAHTTINYVLKTDSYKIKSRANGKIVEENVPLSNMFEKYILVGCYVQAFEFAGYLTTIGLNDREKFIELYNKFF
ncbi:hypothetical protein ABE61_18520 [Lysinibacillus sphaericus]|uniref:hypothetical protein n=1 Tax=Lysinibacillus sphaericus TaxID=1421 RepID=UPI0018CE0B22|nr:hypothetical protein [Lysinibacillus sphaericus]MBG9455979.1 hypothetical protein [Lysinibacillus sphaericus]MBG9479624.1 hypothetical protein [Lysinibacillus sphaericus]MBG9593894.1 hypothetical protein [Lysinibacillus sphaericus]